ncbi:Bbp16 family capsid cement protein [Kiloniella antarctica]|uniref:Bbp16 family capsid cement protein n=1 Tax=Kiloniella antarctica TaxID=1550907 RepID=A0ABW5BIZ8_9PROT
MIHSKQLTFSDQQAITGTASSTNILDLGTTDTVVGASVALPSNPGDGTAVPLNVQVTEAFNNLTSLKIAIEVDDNSGFSSAREVLSQSIVRADLVAGKQTSFHILPKGLDERYMRLRYTVSGTNPSAGKISAAIVAGVQS